jgi:hypothetical protein
VAEFIGSVFMPKPKGNSLLRLRIDTGSVRLDLQLPPETDPVLLRVALQGMKALLENQRADDERPAKLETASTDGDCGTQ